MKSMLNKLIDVAAGRRPADIVIKNCKVVNVFSGTITEADIAVSDEKIAGVGDYEGLTVIDAGGKYAVPGLIDSHIHVESSYLSPEELGKILVPHGTTSILADPHEIVNVLGLKGLKYMIDAARGTSLDIMFEMPSCVPATPFEHSGSIVKAEDMEEMLGSPEVVGLGEFMNYVGICQHDDLCIDKVLAANRVGKFIDGHAPGLAGKELSAYAACRIAGDHECTTLEEMQDRIERGLYVLMRHGSCCHDLETLVKGVTPENSRRCLLCSDDRQPKTVFEEGHIDYLLKLCVEAGIDAVSAVRMATLNAAECFGLKDRGAIAPGYRADLVLVEDLKDFRVDQVMIKGRVVAENGRYLPETTKHETDSVRSSITLKDFSVEKLKMKLKSDRVNVIGVHEEGGIVTKKSVENIDIDQNGEFIFNQEKDIAKIAVVDRYGKTGNVACGLLKGYGIKSGAIALSIAHDSHNIIVVGTSDEEMAFAVESLAAQEGGMIAVKAGKVLCSIPMPIAGLMSDRDGKWVSDRLAKLHEAAWDELGVHRNLEPTMTLCFMALPVIPELKITDMGLFDVSTMSFISVEA